jgi:octaprenyl-diphosphate synthase
VNDLKQRILTVVAGDLAAIEEALTANLKPQLARVQEVAGHILFSGGKRLRPLLLVLAARACGYRDDYASTFAVSLEYLHAATLLHDDLVDEAQMRRGRPAAHTRYGNATAVLVGDFLLARALTLAAGTGNLEIIRVMAGITENMSQGEIQQLSRKGDLTLSEDDYREVIWRKTAVLFQGACRMAGLIAAAPQDKVDALTTYGANLGLAFQIADDLIDYTSDTAAMGKIAGADLREGKLTLPVIAALQRSDADTHQRMAAIIRNPGFSAEDFSYLKSQLQRLGGLDYALDRARQYVQTAKAALAVFEPSPPLDILCDIADYALLRKA